MYQLYTAAVTLTDDHSVSNVILHCHVNRTCVSCGALCNTCQTSQQYPVRVLLQLGLRLTCKWHLFVRLWSISRKGYCLVHSLWTFHYNFLCFRLFVDTDVTFLPFVRQRRQRWVHMYISTLV